MRRTTPAALVIITLASMSVMALVLRALLERRIYLPPVAPIEWLAILILAIGTLLAGLKVRAYMKGKAPDLDPIRAARTWALAKAAAISGAVLAGRYLATILMASADLQITAVRMQALSALVAFVCALILTVIGVIVEGFCELPPPEDPETVRAGKITA